uniref:Nephrocystin 3-like N-terminal domain-containing protein n=1 Tax=Biomphalaria glabrata TaxID=6526 RepID=A0A2C9M6N2_BIOGL
MSPIMETPYLTSIRQAEKDEIKAALRSGQIVQLHGPPMVGKSVLIKQVIDEMQKETSNIAVHYSVDCKALKSFTEFLQRTFQSQESTSVDNLTSARGLTSTLVLDKIRSVLEADPSRLHIFVFHKCEALRMSGNDHELLKFLDCISRLSSSENIKVNVVFTSNVKFPTTGRDIEDVHLRMLTDDLDVESLLRHYSQPTPAMVNHVRICQRVLAFPAGIIQFSKTFLNTASTHSAQSLIPMITSDPEFLASIFQRKLEEATRMRWLDDRDLAFIARCRPVFLRTYTQGNHLLIHIP